MRNTLLFLRKESWIGEQDVSSWRGVVMLQQDAIASSEGHNALDIRDSYYTDQKEEKDYSMPFGGGE